jgi:radical SAM superfamily enzyme YgiQ (UPF0313 family)
MATILLISCNLAEEPYPVFPLGLAMVARAAERRGHTVHLWDPLVEGQPLERAADAARALHPDLIGISIRNIDNINSSGLVSYAGPCRALVRALRAVSSAPVVLGGAGFSLCAGPIMHLTGADYGIVGEGETAFCELIDQLAAGQAPKDNIIFPQAPLPGESFGLPLRPPRWADFYLKAGGMLNVQSKRGCPHRCAYCSYPTLEGHAYRFRPAGDVVDEIERLKNEAGADYFAFTDSVFNDARGHYLQIAEEMVRRGLTIPWMAFFRPQRFTREEVALLKCSGLACVEWGTDCSTDSTLAAMQKNFTWTEVEHANALFNEFGIFGTHFIIFGGPGETERTVAEGLANIERLERCVVLAYCGVRILPATRVRDLAIKEGMIQPDDDLLEAKFYVSPQVTMEGLNKALTASFGTRIDRIWPPDRDLEKVRIFHQMGTRGPIWDLLLGAGRGRRRSRRG